MQKLCTLCIILFLMVTVHAQNIGIGTTTPAGSAILDITSTSKGILIPRMDSTQRNAIASPVQGLMIYQVKGNGGFYYYTGNAWAKIGGGGNEWLVNAANDIYTNKNVGIGNSNPTEKLDISGNIKTSGEIKPNGTAGMANQVLTATGSGGMVWATPAVASAEESYGSGTWGDCSVNGITAFQTSGNENGEVQDGFGASVAISGNYAIVGTPNDDEAGMLDNGSATILKRNTVSGVWEPQGKLLNPAGLSDDEFGRSVAISGDYAIVGTPYDDEGPGLSSNGSATIFKRNSTTGIWESQGKLINPSTANGDFFGWSVAISGDYAIVGAYGDDFAAGSATIFKRNTNTGVWESQGKLFNASPVATDYFGKSVGISGDFAIVGADDDDAGGTATIFKRNTGTGVWEPLPQGKLSGTDIGGRFGCSVSISGDYAIVGALMDNGEIGLSYDGSATIFKRNATTGIWERQVELHNFTPANSDYFGSTLCLSGDYAMIGARSDDEGAGLNDNGSVSIYKRSGSIWRLVQKFTAPNSNSGENFGTTVGIDGTTGRFLSSSPSKQSGRGEVFFGKVK